MLNPDRNYFLFTLLTSLPLYAVTALGQNVLQSGAIATFPMISYWISTFVQAHVASKVSGKFKAKGNQMFCPDHITPTTSRRLFNTVSSIFPGILLLLVVYGGCNVTTVTCLLCAASFMSGFTYSGVMNLNIVDVSPPHAGTFYGICNTFDRGFRPFKCTGKIFFEFRLFETH